MTDQAESATPESPHGLAPRVEGVVRLRDGRSIGFAEYGPPAGRPVLWFHGTPGARRQVPPSARLAADELGVRIVALERPGIGSSTAHAYDSILGWADDVEQAADQLGLDRFGVVGLSGGGPYALAVGCALPRRTVAVAVIGGVAPTCGDDAPEGGVVHLTARYSSLLGLLHEPLGHGLWALVWTLRPFASNLFDLFVRYSPQGDRDVFAAPGMKEMFIDDLLRASRRQFRAPVSDLRLFGRPWGFSPRDVHVPILLWHGAEDYIVPATHGEHLADLMPAAEIEIKPGAAHLANLALGAEVLESILQHWPADEP
jgi:pimeloyl-ACP methyl ester carboxylesterase